MRISNETNITVENMNDDDIYMESLKAKFRIIALYEENNLGDPDLDFKEGACAILAEMMYNIFPNKVRVYLSNDHAIMQIGSRFQDVDSLDTNKTLESIGRFEYYPLDLRVESDRERFYYFLDNCKIQAVNEYGEKLEEIVNQVKKEMGYVYISEEMTKSL